MPDAASSGITDMWMCVMVGRTSESSLPSSSVSRVLDLLVDDRAAEQPRPARMGAPRIEVRGNRLDDLAIEIEAEVVARSKIGEPLVADPDHATVDLIDDRVHHRMRRLERLEVPAGIQPVLDPRPPAPPQRCGSVIGHALTGTRRAKVHCRYIGPILRRLEPESACTVPVDE